MWKYGDSLARKALIAVFILLLPMAVAFLYTYTSTKQKLLNTTLEELLVTAEGYEALVYSFIEMSKRRAEDFASDGLIRRELKRGGSGAALSAHLVKNKIVLDKTLLYINVLDLKGRVVASTDKRNVGKNYFDEDVFKKGVVRTVFLEDHHGGEGQDIANIEVATPVRDVDTGAVIGVLVNDIKFDELDSLVSGAFLARHGAISYGKGSRETLEIYLVDDHKHFLTSSRFLPDVILKAKVDTLPVNACVNESKEMKGYYDDYRGMRVGGVSMCLPELSWTLLTEIDEREVLRPINEILRSVLIAAFIAVLLMFLLYYLFLKYVIRPLDSLVVASEKLAKGDYDIALPVTTSDEIGRLVDAFNSMTVDIRERTAEIKKSEASLLNAQRVAHMGNWDWNIVTGDLHWSPEIYRIFGIDPYEFKETYDAFLERVHPDDRQYVIDSVNAALANEKPYSIDHRLITVTGEERIVHEEAEVTFNNGKPVKMTGTVQDVTEARRSEYELKKLTMVIEQSINLVFITDSIGKIEYVNPTFENISGYSREECIGKYPTIVASGDTSAEDYKKLWNTISSGKTWRGVFKNKKKNGEYFWVSSIISPIRDDKGAITHYLAIQEDVTDRMQAEEKMRYLSYHDELTGLYNRQHFIHIVDSWLALGDGAEGPEGVGVLMIFDLDQFKFINNTYGHGMGDSVLVRIARLVENKLTSQEFPFVKDVSSGVILSRLSADEFAVFLPGLGEAQAVAAAEYLRGCIEHYNPVEISGKLTASIGCALYPSHGDSARKLLSKADAACYRAKELGRNRARLYKEEDGVLEQMRDRLTRKDMIIEAVDNNRFEPWFQPIMNIETGEVSHYEALARLRDASGGIVMPGEFIDTAERFGLIAQVNNMVFEKSLDTMLKLNKAGRKVTFSVNLSGRMIGEEETLIYLKETIKKSGVDPSCIVFEITETAMVQDIKLAKGFIDDLRSVGCHFSLDDFGVGFTSFAYLRELNVSYIKIDGSFVRKLDTSPKDQLLVKSIAEIARGMNVKTIAEFVENEASLNLLKEFSVDYAQGYHVGRPAPFKDLD